MAVVKGSKQVKMVVVPHRPRRYVLFWFSTVILTVVVGSGTYFYGYNAGMNENLNVARNVISFASRWKAIRNNCKVWNSR